MKLSRSLVLATLGPLCLAACGQSDPAPKGKGSTLEAADVIETRKANFKDLSKANKAIKAALESDPIDFAEVGAQARTLNEKGKHIGQLFPAGTGPEAGEKTDALPAIWANPAKFSAAADKLASSSAALVAAAEASDASATKAAAADVGSSCKGCHDAFRVKKS